MASVGYHFVIANPAARNSGKLRHFITFSIFSIEILVCIFRARSHELFGLRIQFQHRTDTYLFAHTRQVMGFEVFIHFTHQSGPLFQLDFVGGLSTQIFSSAESNVCQIAPSCAVISYSNVRIQDRRISLEYSLDEVRLMPNISTASKLFDFFTFRVVSSSTSPLSLVTPALAVDDVSTAWPRM